MSESALSCLYCTHTIVASFRTTLTQLRPVRGHPLRRDGAATAAWDLIQESPAEVKRIETVAQEKQVR